MFKRVTAYPLVLVAILGNTLNLTKATMCVPIPGFNAKKLFFFLKFKNMKRIFVQFHFTTFRPGHAKMFLMPYVNNKGADQPAHLHSADQPVHPHSLISNFVVLCLDSNMYTCFIQIFNILASFCS